MDSVLIVEVKFLSLQIMDFQEMSDAGTDLVSEKFQEFCRYQTMHQAISSSYNHQSNGKQKHA